MRGRAGPGRLRHRVGEGIARHGLWSAGSRVAVAVSGGLDSVALLDLLWTTRAWHGAALSVVTVDHGIHARSAAHADFVRARADALGLACARVILALGASASEAAAREARYAALEELPVDFVALAHHRDDQAETLLLQLLRGAGARGMAAMARRRGRFVRPLLDITREELRAWGDHRGLDWVEDPTNADSRYLRNRLRREVLPLLEALRPGASGALARSAEVAAEDDAALEVMTPRERATEVAFVATGNRALVGRALRAAHPGLEAGHVDALVAIARRGSGSVALPGGRVVEVDGERLREVGVVVEEDKGRP